VRTGTGCSTLTSEIPSEQIEGEPIEATPTEGAAQMEAEPERVNGKPQIRAAAADARAIGARLRQEFFLPVHGLVRLSRDEVAVVDHPAFQHLGYIYQLGQTYLVYRGATHVRFEHALGTRHVADLLIAALERNGADGVPDPALRAGKWQLDHKLDPTEERFVRLGALLHDIGHLPAGHTLEDELGLLPAHDSSGRLRLVWDRRIWGELEVEQTMRQVVDQRFGEDARAVNLRHEGTGEQLSATEIVELLISKDPPRVLRNDDFRVMVCQDLIGNTICADLLDYLHRDWYHLGKERYFDSRLLEYLEIRANESSNGRDARLVINLRSGHKIRTDAVTAILDLLESRYQLSEIALFHRTKLSAAAMLERAIAEIGEVDRGFLTSLEERLLDATDAEMLTMISKAAREAQARSGVTKEQGDALDGTLRLVRSLRYRRLHKHLTSAFEHDLHRASQQVQDRYAGVKAKDEEERKAKARQAAANRLTALHLLERDFDMPPGSLVMYCPGRRMNAKIAQVQVLINDEVHRLDAFEGEERSDRGITGGHLQAQKDRFRRLWRIQFAIEPAEKARLERIGLLQLLGRAIDLCVLRREPSIGTIDDAVAALATELTRVDGSPLFNRTIDVSIAARQQEGLSYPGGARSLLDHATPLA
jgi:HD superfamily phosphohydrolase